MNTIMSVLLRRASTVIRHDTPSPLTFGAAGLAGLTGAAYIVAGEPALDGPLAVVGGVTLVGLVAGLALWRPREEAVQEPETTELRVVAGRNHDAPIPALTWGNEDFDGDCADSDRTGAGAVSRGVAAGHG